MASSQTHVGCTSRDLRGPSTVSFLLPSSTGVRKAVTSQGAELPAHRGADCRCSDFKLAFKSDSVEEDNLPSGVGRSGGDIC